jgi:hypothetical protein
MIVSSVKSSEQMPLFPMGSDKVFRTMAQTRNYVGDFFEAATAAATGAKRMKTDCNADICPDLHYGGETYFESKAIGKTGAAIVYTHRADNDARFLATGRSLYYWFWRHATPAGEMKSLYQLRSHLTQSIQSAAIIEFSQLHRILAAFPIKTLNNKKRTPIGARLGYGTETYKMGWNVRLSAIHEALPVVYLDAAFYVFGSIVRVPVIRAAETAHFEFFQDTTLFQQRK